MAGLRPAGPLNTGWLPPAGIKVGSYEAISGSNVGLKMLSNAHVLVTIAGILFQTNGGHYWELFDAKEMRVVVGKLYS